MRVRNITERGALHLRRRVHLRGRLRLSLDGRDRGLLLVSNAGRAKRRFESVPRSLRQAAADWWCLPLPLVAGGTAIVLLCLAA